MASAHIYGKKTGKGQNIRLLNDSLFHTSKIKNYDGSEPPDFVNQLLARTPEIHKHKLAKVSLNNKIKILNRNGIYAYEAQIYDAE